MSHRLRYTAILPLMLGFVAAAGCDDPSYGTQQVVADAGGDTPPGEDLATDDSQPPVIPCLSASPDSIDFGVIDVGANESREIPLANCGHEPLEVGHYSFSGSTTSAFRLELPPGHDARPDRLIQPPIVLGTGETLTLSIVFAPHTEGEHAVDLELTTGEGPAVSVELTGASAGCPRAVALAQPYPFDSSDEPASEITTEPLVSLLLRGHESVAGPRRTIAEYHWQILEQPVGSYPELNPAEGDDATIAYILLAGRHRFQLDVVDSAGVVSCEPAIVTVEAVAGRGITIETTWINPDDPDPHDFQGADVDVHFYRMGYGDGWFEPPYDLHYANREPFWDPEMPQLHLDDTNGSGPEVITMAEPGHCTWYAFALHYFRPQFGPALANVRVHIDGQLVFSTDAIPLENVNDWWDGLRIHWPSGMVQLVDDLYPEAEFSGVQPVVTADMITSGLCGVPD